MKSTYMSFLKDFKENRPIKIGVDTEVNGHSWDL